MYRKNGLYDWVLIESARDGQYEVVDLVAPDLVHNHTPEPGDADASGQTVAGYAGDNLTWLRRDGKTPELLPPEGEVVRCAQMMLHLAQ